MAVETSERLLEALGLGGAGGRIGAAFRRMDIAEEEIRAAKRAAPRAAKRLHDAFRFLYAPRLAKVSDEVYRAHVREILGRVRAGDDVRPGTNAELLVAFSEASLVAPPSSGFAHAMEVVFLRVFPNVEPEKFVGAREDWPGRTEEIISEMRRKLAAERDVSK